jgi:uncharacterized membrane protein YqgA involved in biofilm formation
MEPSESKNKRTTIAIVGMVVTVVAVVAAAEQDSRILLVRTRDKAWIGEQCGLDKNTQQRGKKIQARLGKHE